MRDAASIRYSIYCEQHKDVPDCARIAKWREQLAIVTRRENKRLAQHLTYKCDIYHRTLGRIISCTGAWSVAKHNGALCWNGGEIDPADLRDGNGKLIYV